MRPPPTLVRIASGIVALAVVVLVFVLGAPGGEPQDRGPESTPSATQPTPSPSAPPSPASAEQFCAAFTAMAAAQANHLANNTDGSRLELEAAAANVRQIAPGVVMSPKAREGLEQLVAGVLEEDASTDQEAADALTAYLEVSCPPGL